MALVAGVAIVLLGLACPWMVHLERKRPGRISTHITIIGSTLPLVAQKVGAVSSTAAAAIAVGCFVLALGWEAWARSSWPVRSLEAPLWILSVGVFPVVVSVVRGTVPSQSLTAAVGIVVAGTCVPLIAASISARCARDQLLALGQEVAGAILVVSLALWGLAPSIAAVDSDELRVSGVVSHPNSLGTIAVAYLVAVVVRNDRLWVILPRTIGAVIVILLTDMRAALLAALVVLAVVPLVRYRFLRTPWALTLLLLSPFLVAALSTLATEALARRSASVASREFIWRYLLDHGELFLPWGGGPNAVYDISLSRGFSELFFHAHNQWLTSVVIGGWTCLGLFTVLFLRVTRVAIAEIVMLPCLVGIMPLLAFESPLHVGWSVVLQAPALCWWLLFVAPLVSPAREDGGGVAKATQTAADSNVQFS